MDATYDNNAMAAGLGIGFFLIMMVIGLAFYLFFGYCYKQIAEKTGHTENSWWAWVPILQSLLMLQVAGKPMWWVVLYFIPFVNLITMIIVMVEVAKARGKDTLWGVLAGFPLTMIIGIPYLALSDGEVAPASVG